MFFYLPICLIFVGQNDSIMKETIFKIALDILLRIIQDLADNGKLDGSASREKNQDLQK